MIVVDGPANALARCINETTANIIHLLLFEKVQFDIFHKQ